MQILKSPEPAKTMKFVRVEFDDAGHEFENICELPIEKHFNDGTGSVFWCNRGFEPYDSYQAKKNQSQVKARRKETEANG